MKKLILTFFLIVLILMLTKRVSFFNEGYTIASLGNPGEPDFYQSFLNDLDSYNSQFMSDRSGGIQKVQRDLGQKIRNYFISLYMHGLEKDYRLIMAFVPANYNNRGITILPQNYSIKDFMRNGGRPDQNGRIYLKEMRTPGQKRNMMRSANFGGKDIFQYHGFLVGMGFRIALSNPRNNRTGTKCSTYQNRPDSYKGICIPRNLLNFNQYFNGGKFYDYNEIYRKGGGENVGRYYGQYIPSRTRSRFRSYYYSARKLNHRPNEGCNSPRHEQRGINFHKANQCQRGCYARSRRHCRSAYGDQSLGDIIITIDVNFFNKFFNSTTNTGIKNEFMKGNFSILDGYHD